MNKRIYTIQNNSTVVNKYIVKVRLIKTNKITI